MIKATRVLGAGHAPEQYFLAKMTALDDGAEPPKPNAVSTHSTNQNRHLFQEVFRFWLKWMIGEYVSRSRAVEEFLSVVCVN